MATNRLTIQNRLPAEPTGGWIHIVPKGELPNRAAGIVQVLDDVSLDSILAGLNADKQRLGNRWPGLYAGREHFVYDDGKDSGALAWFKDFEKRSDGIWANQDGLTPIGQQAIANREYKFTSFCADPKDVQPLGAGRVRILKIDTVGFTNQANGKELLNPINNRGDWPAQAAASAPVAIGANAFSALVNRTKTELGVSFDKAWNLCRDLHPTVFAAVSGPITNRHAPLAADALARQSRALVETYALANSVSQADAFSSLSRSESGRILNRAAKPADVDPGEWSEALHRAPDVLAEIEDAANYTPDRGRTMLFRGNWNTCIADVFLQSVKGLMLSNGWTAKQAFDHIRETEPVLCGAGVMNYRSGDPGSSCP
jgi:hypothetical protein